MKIYFALFLLVISFSCEKKPDPVIDEAIPSCILEEIDQFKMDAFQCDVEPGPSVKSYEFQDSVVYAFSTGLCIADGDTRILNERCEEICILGTILGITNCRGEPFDNAVLLSQLWPE